LIGGGGGKLKNNLVARYPVKIDGIQQTMGAVDRNHNDLLLTLAQIMGADMSTFGDAGLCKGPLSEILAT
jgi:hypothetical protein